MKTTQRGLFAVLAVAATASGCRSESKGATDTNSNWLVACDDDTVCGDEFDCLCGVCSRTCERSQSCADLGSGAACVSVAGCREMAICGTAQLADLENDSPTEPEPAAEPEPAVVGDAGSGGTLGNTEAPAGSGGTLGNAGAPAGSGGAGGGVLANAGSGGMPDVDSAGAGSGGRGGGAGDGSAGSAAGGSSNGGTMNTAGTGQGEAGAGSGGGPSTECTAGESSDINAAGCVCVEDDLWSCTSYVSSCEAPGTPLDVEVRTEYGSMPFSCFDGPVSPRPIRSDEELEAALCGAPFAPSGVDWSSRMMYAAIVSQGQELELLYTTQYNGVVFVGVQGSCAISGAAPGDGVMFIELDIVDAVFVEHICSCPVDTNPEPEPQPP